MINNACFFLIFESRQFYYNSLPLHSAEPAIENKATTTSPSHTFNGKNSLEKGSLTNSKILGWKDNESPRRNQFRLVELGETARYPKINIILFASRGGEFNFDENYQDDFSRRRSSRLVGKSRRPRS